MAYDMYFDKVLFPVAPAKIKTTINNKNRTIELINEGEVNVLKEAGLTKISFTVVLPNHKYPFARYVDGFKNASYYLGVLEEYKKNKKPFQFIISRVLPNGTPLFHTNMTVSLEDYDFEDNVTEGFDTKVTISLKQYKPYGTKTVNVSAYIRPTVTRSAGSGANTAGTNYTIKSGDTLWNIAKKKMGSGAKWTTLYNANKTVIENAAKKRGKASSNNGHWIYPGTVLVIPGANTATASSNSSTANKTATQNPATTQKNTPPIVGTGGSKNYPPFSIVTRNGMTTIKSGFKTWSQAYGYYVSNGGKIKQWLILDKSKRIVEIPQPQSQSQNTQGGAGGRH